MQIEDPIPLLETILADWRALLGDEFEGYRNHVCRMINFCFCLRRCSDEERTRIIIAGAFHDIGIWIGDTVDYIPPSLPPARAYLEQRGLEAWSEEITLMISEHHKLRPYTGPDYPLVEVFRRGDLVDFSLGRLRFGIPKPYVAAVRERMPNAGFHAMLARRGRRWLARHPLDPLPMMKW